MTKRRSLAIGLLGGVAGLLASVLAAFAAEPVIPDGTDFGAGLTLLRAIDLEAVVRDPDQYGGEPILLRGRISDVCQKKGCWTILQQGEASVRVRFKDYAFFLPVDSSGKQAYVEGVVRVETLSPTAARHYAEESKSPAADVGAIRGPQREVGFTATGVRIVTD
jgi:hypothetical protein